MTVRLIVVRAALVALMLPAGIAATAAHADPAAVQACATKLPKDARAIFDATLPQVAPGSDLRSLLTVNTRSLAFSGSIDRDGARQSATAAGECLKLGD
jgi:hypothetical protein